MQADTVPAQAGARHVEVTAWREHQATRTHDAVADEVPVALVFNGISHAVMMASPSDLEDFALGFGLTEGLLNDPSELYGVEVREAPEGLELQLEVASACAWRLKERRRTLAGRTGCGLCGAESLAQLRREPPPVPVVQLRPQALLRAQQGMRNGQAVQQATGAVHAAAWCGLDGAALWVREDVGRHNALDKLVGAMLRAGADAGEGFALISSRASFEMVHKAAMAGMGALAAVSAPTALAIQTAQTAGLALAGFVRGEDFVAYTHPERFGVAAAR